MKVSIITATLNNKSTIRECIDSVHSQSYRDVEHIIIDGVSSDGTLDILRDSKSGMLKWISESDNGIYFALNKGMKMATGDVIGFLHADDFYAKGTVISDVVSAMIKFNVDSCYGDLLYVKKDNTEKVVRYWKSCPYREGLFQRGWMPPHPTFFVRKNDYDRYGFFNTDFEIASDYELMLRFLEKNRISTCYIPDVLIKMRMGGKSNRSLRNILIKTSEDYKAWKVNNLNRPLYTIPFKNFSKLSQFFQR